LDIFPEAYAYETLDPGAAPDALALASVRDGKGWIQLVPERPGTAPKQVFRMCSFHFDENLNAQGAARDSTSQVATA
jgi:hypothetical protein